MPRIHDLTSARIFRIAEDGAEWIGVIATATSPSLGWSNPVLTPWLYTERPADGIQDFDFCADGPARAGHRASAPIAADHLIEKSRTDYWGEGNDLAGVRIHGEKGEIDARFSDAVPCDPATLPEHIQTVGVPWSWSGGHQPPTVEGSIPAPASGPDGSLADIIGTRLRVFETSDRIPPFHTAGDTTICIDPVTRVIRSARLG
jgi:hypothetical protein